MDVKVDGQDNFAVQGEPEDFLGLLGAITDFLRERGRAIVTVFVDGEAVRPEDLQALSSQCPVEEIGRVEVQSRAISELVAETLEELRASVPELPAACRSLAELFHGEVPEEAYDPFNQLANIWSHVKSREAMIANILGFDLNALVLGARPIQDIHTELNAVLEEAAQAITAGDCVLLGDLLEYELAPRAEEEQQIVALLQEKAAAVSP